MSGVKVATSSQTFRRRQSALQLQNTWALFKLAKRAMHTFATMYPLLTLHVPIFVANTIVSAVFIDKSKYYPGYREM